MRKLIVSFLLTLMPAFALAAGGGVDLRHADIDVSDQASLQRGARLFVNYCLSCHSAQFQRYNRMAQDLGLTEQEVMDNLMFTTDKIGDTMTIAMKPEDADKWFGTLPPDLSVVSRARGDDWIFSYLTGFYIDESRPFGVNNRVFPDVGMPHVLWKLQGMQKAVITEVDGQKHIEKLEPESEGSMSPEEFDGAMNDLTAFLSYVGEPIQVERKRLGVWVLLFIALFFVISVLLKKEYWKDVH
ncbi:MAG: cytochrome c1 [Gammaproteobacteria bacterium]|nr:cytochrome c1 [Gammaproteobacteria bacterium]